MGWRGLGKQTTPLASLANAGVYSTDDLGWICDWGGVPLLAWEEVGLDESEAYDKACVADHVEYWLEKENDHLLISDARLRNGLPAMNETEMAMLHWGVCQARWARQAKARRAALAAALAAHCSGSSRGSKRRRVCFADALLNAWGS